MTEQEARQKWCPFVRMTVKPSTMLEKMVVGNNRGQAGSEKGDVVSTACIASDCMAWRVKWSTEQLEARNRSWFGGKPWPEGLSDVPDGYCGLAGKL